MRKQVGIVLLLILGPVTVFEAGPLRADSRSMPEPYGDVLGLAFSPDGRILATVGDDGLLLLAEAATGRLLLQREAHPGGAFALAFSPDGKTLATAGADLRVRLWDVARKVVTRTLEPSARLGIPGRVAAVAFSPDGKTLAAGLYEGRVSFFDLPGFKERSVGIKGRVTSLSFSPDGQTLAVGGATALRRVTATQVVLLDVRSGKAVRELVARGSTVAFAPGGELMLTARLVCDEGDGFYSITLYRPADGEVAGTIPLRGNAVALSGCGRLLAAEAGSDSDRSLRVWEVGSGQEVLKLDEWGATALALSPDGGTLVAGRSRGVVRAWDLAVEAGAKAPEDRALAALAGALAGEPAAAFRAQGALVLAGDRSVPVLAARLAPARALPAKEAEGQIVRLDSEEFDEREAAFAALRKLGDGAEPALRRALQGKPSLEVRRRLERLLRPLRESHLSSERLRQRRALAVLEQVGSPEARKLLARLAEGDPEAALTREAKESLKRLGR